MLQLRVVCCIEGVAYSEVELQSRAIVVESDVLQLERVSPSEVELHLKGVVAKKVVLHLEGVASYEVVSCSQKVKCCN